MIISYVYIEGFGSVIKEVKYKFERPGLNIITGENGVGKTTIFNALSWCLYKQLLKKGSTIDPWPHVIDDHYKGTKVRVVLRDNKTQYEIIRCKDYTGKVFGKKGGNRLVITQDGKELFEGIRDKADHQKWINEKVGYTFDLFKNSILFGQELKRLMQEDGPSKKKVFEEAFETSFITKAKDLADKKLCQINEELSDLEHNEQLTKLSIKSSEERLADALDFVNQFSKNKEKQLKNARAILKTNRTQLKQLRSKLKDKDFKNRLSDIRQKIKTLESKCSTDWVGEELKANFAIRNQESSMDDLKVKIAKLNGKLTNTPKLCDNCGQKLPKSSIDEIRKRINKELKAEKEKLIKAEELLKTLNQKHTELSIKVKETDEIREGIKNLQNLLRGVEKERVAYLNLKSQIKMLKGSISQNKKDILEIEKSKPLTRDIDELKKQVSNNLTILDNITSKIKSTTKKREIYDWLVRDPLSNSGLKSFIFDSMMAKVNNHLKKYSPFIGFEVKVFVELQTAHKNIAISVLKGGDEVPYEDLSKGQKQLVDIVIGFSLHDTVSSIKPLNLIMMDELFESLSKGNVEIVGDIIRKMAQTKSVHLITHQSQFNPVNSYRTHLALNDKGQTKIDSKYAEL